MKTNYNFTEDVSICIDEYNELIIKDPSDNNIYYKDSNGYEGWCKYDKNNNRIYSKNANGYEEWWEYNSMNNNIHWKNSNGYERWYNSKGNEISESEFYSIHNSCVGKTVIIDGEEYTLTLKDN